jgi:hypothetical protein
MKISTITILAVITNFVAPSGSKGKVTALNMVKSQAIPFLKQPVLLDGSTIGDVGDVGFDPLDMAENPVLLENHREAEIRHCRIAMLGAAGWPLSELFDRSLANTFNLKPWVDTAERSIDPERRTREGITLLLGCRLGRGRICRDLHHSAQEETISADEYFPGSYFCSVVMCCPSECLSLAVSTSFLPDLT